MTQTLTKEMKQRHNWVAFMDCLLDCHNENAERNPVVAYLSQVCECSFERTLQDLNYYGVMFKWPQTRMGEFCRTTQIFPMQWYTWFTLFRDNSYAEAMEVVFSTCATYVD